MTKSVANVVPSTDNWGDLIERLNTIADIMSTKVVTVDEAVTTGTAVVNGAVSANTLYAKTLTGGNSSVANVLSITTATTIVGNTFQVAANVVSLSGTNASLSFSRLDLGQANSLKIAGANATHFVVAVNAASGNVYLTTTLGNSIPLVNLANVAIASPLDFDVWSYNTANGTWFNRSISSQITGLLAANGTIGEKIATVDGAPTALNTLNKLAEAINDDSNFHITVDTKLAGKANTSHSHSAADINSGTLALARGGLNANVAALNGLIKVSSNVVSAVSAPASAIVGVSDTQTLTNKTFNLANNTLSGTKFNFNDCLTDGSQFVFDTDFRHKMVKWFPAAVLRGTPAGTATDVWMYPSANNGAYYMPVLTKSFDGSLIRNVVFNYYVPQDATEDYVSIYQLYWVPDNSANVSGGQSIVFEIEEMTIGSGSDWNNTYIRTWNSSFNSPSSRTIYISTMLGMPHEPGQVVLTTLRRQVANISDDYSGTINLIGVKVLISMETFDEL